MISKKFNGYLKSIQLLRKTRLETTHLISRDKERELSDRIQVHLIAQELLAQRQASPVACDRVAILTSIPFWHRSVGNQNRIYELAAYLERKFPVSIAYMDLLTLEDAAAISQLSPAFTFDRIFDVTTAGRLAHGASQDSFNDFLRFEKKSILRNYLSENPCHTVLVEYINHANFLDGISGPWMTIIDTHDVMHLRQKAYEAAGHSHHIQISKEEELAILGRFDRVLAIQEREAEYLREALNSDRVLLAHHAMKIRSKLKDRPVRNLVYIAGSNPANIDSLSWFIRKVLPKVADKGIALQVFGRVCNGLVIRGERLPDNVFLHGVVESAEVAYDVADVVVNPVLFGGGLKIKTVEALARGLPLVTTSEGARGLEAAMGRAFVVEDDANAQVEALNDVIASPEKRRALSEAAMTFAADHFSHEACFGELARDIRSFRSQAPVTSTHEIGGLPYPDERLLVLAERDFPLVEGLGQVFSGFDFCQFKGLSAFNAREDLLRHIRMHSIDRVVFINPYSHPVRLSLYEGVREAGVPFYVFDRGALPQSWFFDPNGFNGESCSYDPALWNHPLSEERKTAARSYLELYRSSNTSLEFQSERQTPCDLHKRYGTEGRKVLFIPLQRANDATVRYLSKNVDGMDGFAQFVRDLHAELDPDDWVIVAKKHPLEARMPELPVIPIADDTHVHGLLEMADAVLTLNSGVGVTSLAFGKPTYCVGAAFYAAPGLAIEVATPVEMARKLRDPRAPDEETVTRFYDHLLERFYCFGTATGYLRHEEDGSKSPITLAIDFSRIRALADRIAHENDEKPAAGPSSISETK